MEIINKNIDHGRAFDWGKNSEDYAKYRDIYPKEFYAKLAELSLGIKDQNALDLGTGTGVLPRNMYSYGAKWTGADISENQILYAEKLSKNAGMNIDYIIASAEDVDFPDKTFDVITACQCFMYFDKSVVLPKLHHMLKDYGHFSILFMAWLPEESEIAKTSENLVLKYNPAWTGGRMTRYELQEPPWCEGMFKAANMLTYDLPVHFTREAWHGRMKACRGIGASGLKESEIQKWEQEHWKYMQSLPEEFDILHYVSILDLEKI